MKLVFISDTHLRTPELPEGDILIHCGDLTNSGSMVQTKQGLKWLGDQNFKYKILVPGNHDRLAETNKTLFELMSSEHGVIALIDQGIQLDGVNFYGSPWQPEFNNWAFNLPRDGDELKYHWSRIRDNTDVLITHSPPFGILDYSPMCGSVGCKHLWARTLELKQLKIHAFGHIHYSYGIKSFHDVKYVNASVCTDMYKLVNEPIAIDL